jgi:hypothetical protein
MDRLRSFGALVAALTSDHRVRLRLRRRWLPVLLYLALAVWATWPLALSPSTRLLLGTEPVATVPLFNVWTIWWNADRLLHGFQEYWDAPIFFPFLETFAWSEPQPATLIVAPVIWLSDSRALAYNVYLGLSLVLNGVFCERLLRQQGAGRAVSVAAGAAMLLLPILHWQRDVLQLFPLWSILWTWTGMLAVARRPSIRAGAQLGVAFGVVCLACMHQGLFLGVLMVLTSVTLGKRWIRWRTWMAVAVAIGIAAILVLPVALPMRRMLSDPIFERTQANVAQLSTVWGDYCAAYGGQWLNWGAAKARPEWYLSPGWIKVMLAGLGVVWGLSRRRWRWWTIYLCATGGLALFLSMGPNLHVGEWHPWTWLQDHIPGFSQVRNVFRFAFFVQMGVVLLAFQALHGLDVVRRRFVHRPAWRCSLAVPIVVAAGVALMEVRPQPVRLAGVPEAHKHQKWIRLLQTDASPEAGVACIPFAPGNSVQDFDITTRWMYLGTYHRRLLVNGYSGFFPLEDFALRDAMPGGAPTRPVLEKFAEDGVEWLVVLRSHVPDGKLPSPPDSVKLQLVLSDDVGVDVYRLILIEPTAGRDP